MTVVSTKEFNAHQKRYLDMAMNNPVIIKRGQNMLIVQSFLPNNEPNVIFEPDADFHRSIPLEEVRDSLLAYIRKKHRI